MDAPCCLLCGQTVVTKGSKRILSVRKKWKASELEHGYYRSGLYRLIYRNDETARLEISGIGQNNCRKNSFFYVPFDQDVGVVGYQYDDLVGVEGILQVPVTRYPLDPYRLEGIRGMPLHVHCWSFIKMSIGSAAEENLAKLSVALRQSFEFRHFDNIGYFPGYCKSDPLDIPMISKTVRISRQRRSRRIDKKKLDKGQSGFSRLPLEMAYMILDTLGPSDISSLLSVAHLSIPDRYWRLRIPRWLFFELNNVKPEDKYDWEYLCLQLEGFIDRSKSSTLGHFVEDEDTADDVGDALAERRRIMETVLDVKENFINILDPQSKNYTKRDSEVSKWNCSPFAPEEIAYTG